MGQKEFDPLAYIENAFLDTKKESSGSSAVAEIDVEVPSIAEFLDKSPAQPHKNGKPKTKFRRRTLDAPRPRRTKSEQRPVPLDSDLHAVWEMLPKNLHFLGHFFDDKVTANYYSGEFKESRAELMRRLLDPELTLEEVSRLLGVCPATVRRYTNRGWLAHHRTKGRQRRFRLSGVVKFVEEHGRHPES